MQRCRASGKGLSGAARHLRVARRDLWRRRAALTWKGSYFSGVESTRREQARLTARAPSLSSVSAQASPPSVRDGRKCTCAVSAAAHVLPGLPRRGVLCKGPSMTDFGVGGPRKGSKPTTGGSVEFTTAYMRLIESTETATRSSQSSV